MTITIIKSTSFIQSMRGLIGKSTPFPFMLHTRFGIHTFGVQFPIDVVILDTNNIVVTIKEHLVPNRIFFWNPMYATVLELPAGTITEKHIIAGQKIILKLER